MISKVRSIGPGLAVISTGSGGSTLCSTFPSAKVKRNLTRPFTACPPTFAGEKLNFFSADGTAVAPTSVTVPATGSIVPGGNYGFTLDQVVGSAPYAGIVYATCNFDNVRGFTYLNGDGTTAGYLGLSNKRAY